jgi:type I restriction enzyme M protein
VTAVANSNQLVQKLWNFCNVLRDDGVSTIEYVEQLTYLLFLKMADERLTAGLGEVVAGPRRRHELGVE